MRRDWGSLGRRLCDVLSSCEAKKEGFQGYVDELARLAATCLQEIEDVCGSGPGEPPLPAAVRDPEQAAGKVADFTHRGAGL